MRLTQTEDGHCSPPGSFRQAQQVRALAGASPIFFRLDTAIRARVSPL